MSTIEERIKNVFALQLGIFNNVNNEVLNDSTCETLGGDSLDHVEVIMEIEDEFGIYIQDDDAEKLRTVQSLIDHVTTAIE